jgi:hypothetical protein
LEPGIEGTLHVFRRRVSGFGSTSASARSGAVGRSIVKVDLLDLSLGDIGIEVQQRPADEFG